MTIDLIKYKSFTFIFSGILFIASVYALVAFGLKPGIDFTGGSLMEVSFTGNRPDVTAVQEALSPLDIGAFTVQPTKEKNIILKMPYISEEKHQKILETLRASFSSGGAKDGSVMVSVDGAPTDAIGVGTVTAPDVIEERIETIGPSISANLRSRSLVALLAVNFAIMAFVAYAFRKVSKPVASWKYGLATIIALIHDIGITMGVFAILGLYMGVEVDIAFVVALMTILGYSVNDTIVVFDRIRENLIRFRGQPFTDIVSKAVKETLGRSINTSITILLALCSLYFFGGASIKYFSLALIIGISFGTYSSGFVASALLAASEEWRLKRLATVA